MTIFDQVADVPKSPTALPALASFIGLVALTMAVGVSLISALALYFWPWGWVAAIFILNEAS